jgi:FlaA1/EpsC-like NDP-sugar epimerase
MSEKSLIREYFNGKSVFITGATGFVGKVIIFLFIFKNFRNYLRK